MVMSHQRLADENRRTAVLQERAANLQMLDGLLNALTGVLDVREVFDRISAVGNTVMPHDGMTIIVAPESGTRLTIYAATGALGHLPVPFDIDVPDPSLLERVWDENVDPFTNTARMVLVTLRRKLGDPQPIETLRGAGYRLR